MGIPFSPTIDLNSEASRYVWGREGTGGEGTGGEGGGENGQWAQAGGSKSYLRYTQRRGEGNERWAGAGGGKSYLPYTQG